MEILGLVSIPTWIIGIIVFVGIVYLYSTWPFSQLKALGVPHPRPYPFLGNLMEFLGEKHFGMVDLEMKQKYGSVFGMYEGRIPSVVAFDRDVLKQFLVKDFSSFMDRREFPMRGIIGHSILDVCGDRWRKQRLLMSAFFTTSKLRQMIPQVHQCTDNLIRNVRRFAESDKAFDAKKLTGAFSMDAICLMSYGIAVNSLDDVDSPILRHARLLVDFKPKSFLFLLLTMFPFIGRILDRLNFNAWPSGAMDYFGQLVNNAMDFRLQNPGKSSDFIELMLKAHKEDLKEHSNEEAGMGSKTGEQAKKGLTRAEILANAVLFLMAGYDTVSTTLSFFLFNMADNQECQEKLYRELIDVMGSEKKPTYEHVTQMTYLEMCVAESMRKVPSAFRLDRRCVEETTIKGIRIPKGALMVMPIWGLHHDPDIWPEPDKFDPERFHPDVRHNIDSYMYMPFGTGPRNCVGMRLAQTELKMAAIETLLHFKLTVDEKMQLPMELESGFFPIAKGGTWLRAEARK